MVFNRLAQDLATVGRRLSDLVLGSVPRLPHLLVHLYLRIFAGGWTEACLTHWIIPPQVGLAITWHGLRLAYHVVGIVLSAHEPLPSSRMAFPRSTWNIGGWLFIHWLNLLRVVTIEKVHARVWACLILVIYAFWRLRKLPVCGRDHAAGDLLVRLALALISRQVLRVPHFIGLARLTGILIILLKLILIQAGFGYPRPMTSRICVVGVIMRILSC